MSPVLLHDVAGILQTHRATASVSSGFHPQSNGQTERLNQEIETTLRGLALDNTSSWSSWLPWAEYAHNTLQSSATSMSPFQCQFRFQPPLFPEQEEDIGVPSLQLFLRRCRRTWTNRPQANRCRRPFFRPCQRVWLSSQDIPLGVESCKLAPRYIGPFKVVRKINPITYQLLPTPPFMSLCCDRCPHRPCPQSSPHSTNHRRPTSLYCSPVGG